MSIDPGTGGLAVLGLAADARGPRSSPTGPFSRAVFVAVRTSDRSRPCTAAVVAAIRRATSE